MRLIIGISSGGHENTFVGRLNVIKEEGKDLMAILEEAAAAGNLSNFLEVFPKVNQQQNGKGSSQWWSKLSRLVEDLIQNSTILYDYKGAIAKVSGFWEALTKQVVIRLGSNPKINERILRGFILSKTQEILSSSLFT
jgi:hypothetical protein